MKRVNLEIIKERIIHRYDPDEIVDMLGLGAIDILDAFEDNLIANLSMFPDCLDVEWMEE